MSGDRGGFDPARFAKRVAGESTRAIQRNAEESARRDEMIMSSLGLIAKTVEGLQEDVRRGTLNDLQAERRFNELESQILETREAVHMLKTAETQAAARGGAEGAAAGLASSKIVPAIRQAVNKPGRYTVAALVMIFLIWLTTFIEKAPKVFRATESFWHGVKDLDK